MQKRTEALVAACALAALVVAPAQARLGVDEESSSAAYGYAPAGSGGSGSHGGGSGYHDDEGGFVLTSSDGDFKLLIGGRLQPRFDSINWDDMVERDTTATFQVRRARLYLIGHVMGESNRYFVQLGADSEDQYLYPDVRSTGDLQLYDAWIKHVLSDEFSFKFGQFKTPIGRQNLTSSGKLQLPTRALATNLMMFDERDIGVELSGGFEEGLVQYALAVTNGDGRNTTNLDDSLAFTARVSFNPTGDYGYSEGDLKDRDEVASTIGVAVRFQEDQTAPVGTDLLSFNVEGGVKSS